VVFGLFKKKKSKISIVPPPPSGDLPSFPSPQELDDFLQKDKTSLKFPELPELPEPSMPQSAPHLKFNRPASTAKSAKSDDSPVFLKADSFQAVLGDINDLRARLEKSNRMIARLEEVHDSQNHLLHNWHETLKDFHEKLLFVDEILFKR